MHVWAPEVHSPLNSFGYWTLNKYYYYYLLLLLFLLCFIASWTWDAVSVMLYPCMFCIALSMDLFVLCVACLTVFVNCLVKQFAKCLGVLFCCRMWLLCVVGGALLDRPFMVFHRMCVLCLWFQWASRCSFHMCCLCFCMSEVISSFKSLRTGSQVFSYVISLSDFAYYVFR